MIAQRNPACPQALLDLLADDSGPFSGIRRLRRLGLAHVLRGEMEAAHGCFSEALSIEDCDLLSAHYISRTATGGTAENAALRLTLRDCALEYIRAGNHEPVPLYYAGHLFLEHGMLEGALRCFGRAGDFLPALYMEVELIQRMQPEFDLTPAIAFLHKVEAIQAARGGFGFLTHHAPDRVNPADPGWEKVLFHHANRAEIASAVELVKKRMAG